MKWAKGMQVRSVFKKIPFEMYCIQHCHCICLFAVYEACWWIEIHGRNICQEKPRNTRNVIQCLLGEVPQQCLSKVQYSPGAIEVTMLTQVCTKYRCSDCNTVVRTLLGWEFLSFVLGNTCVSFHKQTMRLGVCFSFCQEK